MNCFPRSPSREKCRKVSFPRTQQNGASRFEPRPSRLQSRRSNLVLFNSWVADKCSCAKIKPFWFFWINLDLLLGRDLEMIQKWVVTQGFIQKRVVEPKVLLNKE